MPVRQEDIPGRLAPLLLPWYRANARKLPFRQNPTPYGVWVSEIMLQQTRVAAALDHYRRFMEALPTIRDLADCPEQQLLKLWEGLGYYSRARNLQKAAQAVVEQYGGQLPADYDALRKLPGIGDYTAGAIGSICFGLPVPAVDGNVLRVFARLYDDHRDVLRPAVKRDFTARVLACQPPDAAGDYNQALMELGALVCLPGSPQCLACPASSICRGYAAGTAAELPVKTPPKARRIQPVTVLLVQNARGEYLLQQRPQKGLLAGLWQPLLAEEALDADAAAALLEKLGLDGDYLGPGPEAKHIFSHIEWRMTSLRFETGELPAPVGCVWAGPEQLRETYPLPGAFKVYRAHMLEE